MGIYDRLAGKVAARLVEKNLSFTTDELLTYFATGQFGDKERVGDPFQAVPYVYACVHTKAVNISRVPLKLYKGDKELSDTDMNNPAVRLLKYPNAQMSGSEFIYWIEAALNLHGNAYAYWNDWQAKLPQYMIPVNAVKPILRNGWIDHYEIGDGAQKIRKAPEEVLHTKYFAHATVSSGTSPLHVLKKKYQMSFAADVFNEQFFQNDATPLGIFKFDRELTEEDQRRFKHNLIEARRGKRGALLLPKGSDYQSMSTTHKDMDFINMYKQIREDIGAVLGVPESEVNIYTQTKYTNASSASVSFWEKTLMPEANLIAESLNRQVFRAVGLECAFDFDRIDAIASKGFGERVDQAVKLVGIGFSVNEVNERLELGFDPDVDRTPPEPKQPAVTQDVTEPGKPKAFEAFEHIQAQKWHTKTRKLRDIEFRMTKALKDYYHKVERKILRAIGNGKTGVTSFVFNKAYNEADVAAAFSNKELEDAVSALIRESIIAGAESLVGRNIADPVITQLLNEKLIKVVTTNATSRDVVIDRVRAAIAETSDLGVNEIAKKIRETVGDAMEINRNRATTIARTEVSGAYNQAGYKAAEANGAVGVRWISSRDSKVRDSHDAYDGQVMVGGELFGGELAFPHDPNGPAEEVINCRCIFEPMYQEDMI